MDPALESILLALARAVPDVIVAIGRALSIGADPEEALRVARESLPKRIDTAAEDARRREEITRRERIEGK